MKAASSSEIKNALKTATAPELMDLCLRLARHKKENKELLTYLLFEATDTEHYIGSLKKETEAAFEDIRTTNVYLIKKSLRKILRDLNKHIRFIAQKNAEAELLLHFCHTLKYSGIPYKKSTALLNLYNGQLKKIENAISHLHEDLQYDYRTALEKL